MHPTRRHTAQVARSHKIYSEADNVCIWLGEGEVDPEKNHGTFAFIRAKLNLQRLDQLILSEGYAEQWYAFVRLSRNRGISRRGVVQELALRKRLRYIMAKDSPVFDF